MRLTRIVVVAALAASTAAVVAPGAAGAAPGTLRVFTMSRSLGAINRGPAVFDETTAGLSADAATTPGAITFSATPITGVDSNSPFTVRITPPETSGVFPINTPLSTAADATASDPGLLITGPATCGTATGTLTVAQADPETSGQALTDFAATYTFECNAGATVSGTLRWNSDLPYTALDPSPAGWDFGWQTSLSDGTAKTFTIVNRGSGDAQITGATFPDGAFKVTGGTCAGATVTSGNSCTVVVTPHPLASISTTYLGTLRSLHLTLASGALDIPARVEGRPFPTTYLQPGPARITFHWGLQPNPIGSSLARYSIYRGTIGQPLHYLRQTSSYLTTSFTDTAITSGRPYYYAVRPVFTHGAGDVTQQIGATAWPAYSSGMYHRISTSQRIMSSRTIVSGHPYTLQVTGTPGVPTTGVSAVALQVTAAKPTSTTAVTVYPYGTSRPAVPDLTVTRGSARTNYVLARIGSGGKIVLSTSSGYTPVSVDVFGFYSAAGLSTVYGQGGAMHTYLEQGTILDTKAFGIGALRSGNVIDVPVNFTAADTPHVTSMLIEITAYASTKGGTITAFPTNHNAPATSVLTYAGGRVTTNVSLVAADQFIDSSTGDHYPSVTVYNRGSTAVQLIVTILGFVDDNTFSYGERYAPGSAGHLLSATVYTGSTRTLVPSTNVAGPYTTALNTKVLVGNPVLSTAEALWPGNVSNVNAPARPQVRANARETTVGSAPAPLGNGNRLNVRNTAGQARLDVWSVGRFDYYPQPTSPRGYLMVAAPRADRLAPGAAPTRVLPVRAG